MKEFLYIDVDGIDLLYCQTVERLEISQTETHDRLLSGKVGMSGKLKSLFLGFLGQVELNAVTEAIGSKGASVTTIRTLSVHGKLKSVMEALNDNKPDGVCFPSLGDAAKYSLENSQKVFFCGRHKFDARQFIYENGAVSVTADGNFKLECGYINHYNDSDDYFKYPKFKAIMSCSIQKMPRSKNGMSMTGHDAIYFRGFDGTQIPLGVFCSVIPFHEHVQLKPYAIWI